MLCTQASAVARSVQGGVQLPRRAVTVVVGSQKVAAARRRSQFRCVARSNVDDKQESTSSEQNQLAAAGAALLPLLLAAGPASASPQEVSSIAESIAGVVPVQNVLAGLVIFFIIAQGPKGEGMVNSMNESRMFNFSETRNFVTVATWGLIGGFLVFSALAALR